VNTAQAIGLTQGDNTLSFVEIESWMRLSGVPLTLWDVQCIHGLSIDYVNALDEFREEKEQPPYMSEEGKKRWAIRQERGFDAMADNAVEGSKQQSPAAKRQGARRR